MTTLRALRTLVLGETWWLPVGIALVVAGAALVAKPVLDSAWDRVGGFVLLAGILAVLATSVARGARGR
jgi:hypothetical protein